MKDRTKDPHFVSNPQYSEHVSEIIDGLKKRRKAERDSVVPFMNGDFTGWDLYLAASCEYCMRLVDGMIPMLKSRNFVCAAQLLRAQIRACMRTFALFVCDDVNVFLQTFFSNGRIDKLKGREGERLTDARLKRLLCQFDSTIEESYNAASGLTHYSFEVVAAMSVAGDNHEVGFNFGMEPNEEINSKLLECGHLHIRYLDLHLQILSKVVESDEWYNDRSEIRQQGN